MQAAFTFAALLALPILLVLTVFVEVVNTTHPDQEGWFTGFGIAISVPVVLVALIFGVHLLIGVLP